MKQTTSRVSCSPLMSNRSGTFVKLWRSKYGWETSREKTSREREREKRISKDERKVYIKRERGLIPKEMVVWLTTIVCRFLFVTSRRCHSRHEIRFHSVIDTHWHTPCLSCFLNWLHRGNHHQSTVMNESLSWMSPCHDTFLDNKFYSGFIFSLFYFVFFLFHSFLSHPSSAKSSIPSSLDGSSKRGK